MIPRIAARLAWTWLIVAGLVPIAVASYAAASVLRAMKGRA